MQTSMSEEPDVDVHETPTTVMVVGSRYKVDFGPSANPQVHLVDKQRRCSCELGSNCPAIAAVVEYLRNGGQRAPDPQPSCPMCGAETVPDPVWDGKYTKEPGWRCTRGGLSHFLQAKAERIKTALRQRHPAAGEHETVTGR